MPASPGARPDARALPDSQDVTQWAVMRVLLCLLAAGVFGAVTAVAGGMVAAMALLGAAACAATLANYQIGLWLLVLLMVPSAAAIFPRELFGITGANPFNALLALTLLAFIADRVWRHKAVGGFTYPRLWWAFLIPVIFAGLAGVQHFPEIPPFAFTRQIVHFTSPAGYLRDALIKPLIYVLIAVLLGMACRDGMKSRSVIVAMCLSVWLFGAWVFYYVLSSGMGLGQLASASNREFLNGVGMHANELGALAACTLTLMIFAISAKGHSAPMRALYTLTGCLAGAMLVISFSRGAFVGFAVSLMVFFIMQRRLKTIFAGLFILMLMLPLLPAELYDRLSTGLGTGGSKVLHSADDPLTAGRVAGLWIPLLAEVKEQPWFGNGLLAVAWSAPLRNGTMSLATLNPHNLYLKLLLEIGAAGFILVMLFFADMWRRFRQAAKNPGEASQEAWVFNGAAAALLGFAAMGMSGGDYLPDPTNCLLWITWGLSLAVVAASARPAGVSAVRHLR